MGLQLLGPRFLVEVSLLPEQRKDGSVPTSSVPGTAVVDTGSSTTCIDIEAARSAGLPTVNTGVVQSATGKMRVPIFAGEIKVPGIGEIRATQAYGIEIAPQGLVALLGRDILSSCVFTYNGPAATFTLSL